MRTEKMNTENLTMKLNFKKMDGLIPAIIQDHRTGAVLMLGFMNPEAYEKTCKERRVTFYSRTKNRLWTKGEESGNFLNVVVVLHDCDNDTLLIRVNPAGPACPFDAACCWADGDCPGGWCDGAIACGCIDLCPMCGACMADADCGLSTPPPPSVSSSARTPGPFAVEPSARNSAAGSGWLS